MIDGVTVNNRRSLFFTWGLKFSTKTSASASWSRFSSSSSPQVRVRLFLFLLGKENTPSLVMGPLRFASCLALQFDDFAL
jgi:hypothetical protein